jgi:hypothetical protein
MATENEDINLNVNVKVEGDDKLKDVKNSFKDLEQSSKTYL